MPVELRPLPDAAALRALKNRGATMLESWDWQDVGAEVHKQAFTVAKSTGFDILGDIHASLQDALANGEPFASWQKRIRPILAEKGWWGKRQMRDPRTGEIRTVQLGSPRRLSIIYDTNMRVSHAQGRWERTERLAKRLPYLRYVAVLDRHTRPSHRSWHGTVLRWDDPWWSTHYPPNGWRCRCTTMQIGERDLKRHGWKPDPSAPIDRTPPRLWVNPRTGETQRIPPGIDPGWAHNPGKRPAGASRAMAALAPLPPHLAAVAPQANPGLIPQATHEHTAWIRDLAQTMRAAGTGRSIGVLSRDVLTSLSALEHQGIAGVHLPRTAVINLSDANVLHWLRDAKATARTASGLPRALDLADLARLPAMLSAPQAVLWDTRTRAILYVFSPTAPVAGGRLAKAVVRLDYAGKINRQKIIGNGIVSGGYDSPADLRSKRYILLSGKV